MTGRQSCSRGFLRRHPRGRRCHGRARCSGVVDNRVQLVRHPILRLGAVKEAELRNERILADGRLRTSVVFGVIAEEWPGVKRRLEGFLGR